MQKFIPYEKLSKKEKKKYNALKRNLWTMKPTERVKQSERAYVRRKIKSGRDQNDSPVLFCYC